MRREPDHADRPSWRFRLHEIVFEADNPAGKTFDIVLILAIVLSVWTIMLDSVADIHARIGDSLLMLEWLFTILFTVEYGVRLLCVGSPRKYATSFYAWSTSWPSSPPT